ncbi:serine/threonine protein phosphatase [bacterium]|nr:MAG: serine/threonine protein phosphatase [bacterium]
MRTLAIGDIHGFSSTLENLLDFIAFDSDNDRLIFLGDYIDRGPNSRQVIEKLVELSANPKHIFLRGNHDEWLLEAYKDNSWFKSWLGWGVGGKETLRSYGAASFSPAILSLIPQSHFDFLESTRLFFETDDYIFVHASISWKPPEENSADELLWPTFEQLRPHPSGKTVICGHSSQSLGIPANKDYGICIDTFCSGEGWLSAFDVESFDVFQANKQGETRQFNMSEF